VNVVPPSLDIEAIISVFNVGVSTSSSNITIRADEASADEVNPVDTIVVEETT